VRTKIVSSNICEIIHSRREMKHSQNALSLGRAIGAFLTEKSQASSVRGTFSSIGSIIAKLHF
jgi:hypothetical protein